MDAGSPARLVQGEVGAQTQPVAEPPGASKHQPLRWQPWGRCLLQKARAAPTELQQQWSRQYGWQCWWQTAVLVALAEFIAGTSGACSTANASSACGTGSRVRTPCPTVLLVLVVLVVLAQCSLCSVLAVLAVLAEGKNCANRATNAFLLKRSVLRLPSVKVARP